MEWISARSADELAISVLTFGELKRGVSALEPGRRRLELVVWLEEALSTFGDHILPIDMAVASAWAEVWTMHKRAGRAVGVVDELIAATALRRGLVIVTRNTRHFDASGCELSNPWSS
ncbi:MAG: type II toxin-antitoxin system VapC family toxin [Caulobacteraceae bacterium]